MRIQMIKFGKLLNSRPAGREAGLRVVQIVNGSAEQEDIILDFSGVEILTPSYADEFLHLLWDKYSNKKVKIENAQTTTVTDSLKAIKGEPVHK